MASSVAPRPAPCAFDRRSIEMGNAVQTADTNVRAAVRSLADFTELRDGARACTYDWWPEIGPIGDPSSFSFTHRTGRVGPISLLDADFHDDVWVNGGEHRPHYHVTLP